MAADDDIFREITALVNREHELHRGEGTPQQQDELAHLDRNIDQLWDLLRQRRAARAAGNHDEAAALRPENVVERYQQ